MSVSKFEVGDSRHFKVVPPIKLTLPKMKIPFGLDKLGTDYFFKLSFFRLNNNLEYSEFYNFIVNFERRVKEELKLDNLKSTIYSSPRFDPNIQIKIPMNKDKFCCEFVSDLGSPLNILYDLDKGSDVICEVIIDTIWNTKGKYSYKIKAKKITKCVS